jgi:hypothetical protein
MPVTTILFFGSVSRAMARVTVATRVARAVTREKETREVTRLGAIAWRAPKTAEEATAAILG